jgi:hypothetical protein
MKLAIGSSSYLIIRRSPTPHCDAPLVGMAREMDDWRIAL